MQVPRRAKLAAPAFPILRSWNTTNAPSTGAVARYLTEKCQFARQPWQNVHPPNSTGQRQSGVVFLYRTSSAPLPIQICEYVGLTPARYGREARLEGRPPCRPGFWRGLIGPRWGAGEWAPTEQRPPVRFRGALTRQIEMGLNSRDEGPSTSQFYQEPASLPPEGHSIAERADRRREEYVGAGFSTRVWHARYRLGGWSRFLFPKRAFRRGGCFGHDLPSVA